MKLLRSYLFFTLSFTFYAGILQAQTATVPTLGTGTSDSPYQIGTIENLYWIAANTANWNKYYIQTADIDASETLSWFSDGADGFFGWLPIGNSSVYFTGSYNGQNFRISNLYINRSASNYIGLFGWIYSPGIVQNIKLQNINVSGDTHVGGLAGQCGNSTTVSYCSGDGIVNGGTGGNVGGLIGNLYVSTLSYSYFSGSVTGKNAVGGLVGCNNASITNYCYSTANVTLTGNSEFAGGLVGYSYGSSSTISFSYATGDVTGYSKVGGFIGSNVNYANINDCYSTGSATAPNWAGGFVGYNNYSYITRAYSTGAVSGASSYGGLIGTNTGWCYNSFWDNVTSLQSGSTGGTGKSTEQMKTQSTFETAGWDFASSWEMIGINYPRLKSNPDPSLPVELTFFIASLNSNTIILEWKTATEKNNFGFEIERTVINNQPFVVSWNNIGFVEGNGTTNSQKQYFFTDKYLSAGKYLYRLKQIDRDGKFSYSQEVEVTINSTPKEFALKQNYPNPFNPATTIEFTLAEDGFTTLKIYDMLGREVSTLVSEELHAGILHHATFDASNISSGLYFYRLETQRNAMIRKLVLMK